MYNIIISNGDERLQGPTSLLNISSCTKKHFFENYRQFGHALSEGFASTAIGHAHYTAKCLY
jgi:hypothetical protein